MWYRQSRTKGHVTCVHVCVCVCVCVTWNHIQDEFAGNIAKDLWHLHHNWVHHLLSARMCLRLNPAVVNWRCQIMQIDLYNGHRHCCVSCVVKLWFLHEILQSEHVCVISCAAGGIRPFGPVYAFATQTPAIALEGLNITLRCFYYG